MTSYVEPASDWSGASTRHRSYHFIIRDVRRNIISLNTKLHRDKYENMEFPLDLTMRRPSTTSGGSSPTSSACSSETSGSHLSPPCPDYLVLKTVEDATTNYRGDVGVSLLDSHTWRAFHSRGTEMIINRNGRRMFPQVTVLPTGLVPSALYNIWLEIQPADNHRYKYAHKTWVPVSRADPCMATQSYLHPDSPNTGAFWMQKKVSFARLKLTNNRASQDGNILLQSMHKYQAEVIISEAGLNTNVDTSATMNFTFHETSFIAVTAYQNEQITKMKILNNPFARAFRDNCSSNYENSKRNVSLERKSDERSYSRKRKAPIMAREDTDSLAHYARDRRHTEHSLLLQEALWRYGNLPFIRQEAAYPDVLAPMPLPLDRPRLQADRPHLLPEMPLLLSDRSHLLAERANLLADMWPVTPYMIPSSYMLGAGPTFRTLLPFQMGVSESP